jgi:hypothetical protein
LPNPDSEKEEEGDGQRGEGSTDGEGYEEDVGARRKK